MTEAEKREEAFAARDALNTLRNAKLDYVTEIDPKTGSYTLSIQHGSAILTRAQVEARDFKGDGVHGRGKTLEKALVSLANSFLLATSGGYVATFAPNGEHYRSVRVLKNSASGIREASVAVVTNDDEMKVMSFFPPSF